MPNTKDHNKIMQWAKERDAHPAMVKKTETPSGGLLRFDFGEPNQSLDRVDWNQFFKVFDEKGLELIYDENPNSRFHKFTYEK